MERPLKDIVDGYDANLPLSAAQTLSSDWYIDPRIFELERRAVFSDWQVVGRLSQVAEPGQFFTIELAGEPLLIVRGRDGVLRAFYNVCRHHAAAVVSESAGRLSALRCPYHGWTYALDGSLRSTPDFDGVCGFDRAQSGLVPVSVQAWESFVCVRLATSGATLETTLGGLAAQVAGLALDKLQFAERRVYTVAANWKVYIDNYLDGSYHVPHIHKGLSSIIDYKNYLIELGPRYCLQQSPLHSGSQDGAVAALRPGEQAAYYWLYPNFMINWYEGVMDTNLVLPVAVDRTEVIFDMYFADVSASAHEHNRESIELADRIQEEDATICASVQRGLRSRSYGAGRLSVRREAGEHLFHRLLHADVKRALTE